MHQVISFLQDNAKSKFYGFSMAVYLYAINSDMSPLSWNLGGICGKTVLDFLHCCFYKVTHNRSYLRTFCPWSVLPSYFPFFCEKTGPETVQNRPSIDSEQANNINTIFL